LERVENFHVSTHGGIRARERELSIEDMKAIINSHDHKCQLRRGGHGGFVYKFTKAMLSKNMVVIAEVKKKDAWIVSGWCEA